MNIMKDDKLNKSKLAAIRGKANEIIVLGILLPHYPNTMLSPHELSSHDMSIPISRSLSVRAQIKTSPKSISFTGGIRAGIDKTYKSSLKEYTYSADILDLVIGIKENSIGNYALYFVPTKVIDKLGQKSISVNKVLFTENDFEVIERCTEDKYCDEFLKKINSIKQT
jgi:hypothetical protein